MSDWRNRQYLRWITAIFGLFATFVALDAAALDLAKARQQFAYTSFVVADIGEANYEEGPALSVTFSVPLDPAGGFADYLGVSLKDGPRVEGGWILSESGTTAYFTNIEPETAYAVTVYQGVAAVTGAKIAETQSQTLKTRPLQANVAFASSGHVLPVNHSQGLPLYTVNVAEVDVDFHRVKSDRIAAFLQSWQERQGQSPWDLQRYKSFIDLVHSGRFQLDAPKNKRYLTNIPVKDLSALRDPGVYLVVMKGAGDYPYSFQTTYFVVSDIGVHARFYGGRIDAYLNSLEHATPLGGVEVSLLDQKGDIVGASRSTPEGFVTFQPVHRNARFLLARQGDHLALLPLYGPALDLSAFDLGKRAQRSSEAFVYGPRDLYRPGENVIFNVLLRDGDARLAGMTPLRAILRQPDNRTAFDKVWQGNDLAYYHDEYPLAKNAPTGEWRLQLQIGSLTVGEYRFKVEEFLPERMKLTLDDGSKRQRFLDAGVELNVPVVGQYLYGAPAAGNRLSTLATVQQQRHPLDSLKDFQFGDIRERDSTQRLELPDTHLDAQGKGEVKVGNQWRDARSPLDIFVVGSLYESGGRPVVRGIHYTLWPTPTILGIRPTFKDEELDGDSLAGFEIVNADREGTLHSIENLEVKLIREHRDYYWSYSDGRGWQQEFTEKHYTAFTGTASIGEGGTARLEVPVEWGMYRLEVRDPASGIMSSLRFRAGWWYGGRGTESTRPDAVNLTWDKRHYRAGDIARLTVKAPYAGEGIITVEAGEVLWRQRIAVAEEGVTVEIPVDPAWARHDLYASAVVLRPVQTNAKHMPTRAIGLVPLRLDREGRRLAVSLTPQAEKVEPETTLRARIKIEGIEDTAKPVMVTVAAVDVGVLNITDFQTPDAHDWFFAQRRYQVDSRDMYGAIIDSLEGGLARQRFGGDADVSRGGKRAQSEVQIVSLFSAPLVVDARGEAVVEFALPDFNGRLRLMALAFGEQQYGAAEAEVTVAAPVVAEIAMPRFLAAGDRSQVAFDIQNLSGQSQVLVVEAQATAPLSLDTAKHTFELPDGGKRVITFALTAASDVGQGEITLRVRNKDDVAQSLRIERRWRLNVRPAYPAVTRQQRVVLAAGERLALGDDLDGLIASTLEGSLAVGTRPPIDLNAHLRYLLSYPYGCLEQTLSSTYPWLLARPETIERLGLTNLTHGGAKLDRRIEYLEDGLRRVANLQLASGGFGLWSGADDEAHWLTAYAGEFMLDAREQALPVDTAMYEKTMNRLLYYMNTSVGMFGERWVDNPAHYRFAYRAYAAYVLSRVNRAPLGTLRTMFDQQRDAAVSGLPLVHLGIALINQGDKRRGEEAIAAGLQKRVPADRYYFSGDYGSNARDLALIVYLLTKHNLATDKRDALLFELADAVRERQYLSTQERLALLRAGALLALGDDTRWAGEMIIAQARQLVDQRGRFSRVFSADQLMQRPEFVSKHDGKLFAESITTGYPLQAPPPRTQDIRIERDYYDIDGKLVSVADAQGRRTLPTLHSGDLVLVHVRVSAERRIPDALLVDLLPAGLELENQNLTNAIKLDQFRIDGKSLEQLQQQRRVLHQEYRDDRFVAAFDLFPGQSTDLFYIARAVTPGVYTLPPAYAEDMYRPFLFGVSHDFADLSVLPRDAP